MLPGHHRSPRLAPLRWLIVPLVAILLATAVEVPRIAPTLGQPQDPQSLNTSGAGGGSGNGAAASQLGDPLALREYRSGQYSWLWRVSLPQNRLVLYYGNPLSPVLGPIGRYDDPELVSRLRAQAAVYARLDPAHPPIAGFDYVSPVAQPDPQKDGTYTRRMDDASIRHYIELARQNHLLFFFDLQIGHSTVAREIDALWPYIQLPWVNVALDPEFDMAPGDIPGVEFGRMYAKEINAVIDRLSELTISQDLPSKMLILHWFRPGLIVDWQNVKLKPGVSVITSDDGVGPPGPKIDDYNLYDKAYLIQYPGIKIFYELDKPVMQPEDVVRLDPAPNMVMYQ